MCLQVPLRPLVEPQMTNLHPDNYTFYSKLNGSDEAFYHDPKLQCSF